MLSGRRGGRTLGSGSVPNWPTHGWTGWGINYPEAHRRKSLRDRGHPWDSPGVGGDYEQQHERTIYRVVGGYAEQQLAESDESVARLTADEARYSAYGRREACREREDLDVPSGDQPQPGHALADAGAMPVFCVVRWRRGTSPCR